ncbi:MAG: O-antigen ligase family protein [Chthoniobacterales bacterium]
MSTRRKSRTGRTPTPEFTWEDLATGILPVLACFLGGATEKWAEGIIVALVGGLLILNPPRFSLGPLFHGILLALIGVAALGFLPNKWFYLPAWRQALTDDFGITLGSTLSPQPWITLGCFLSFIAGLSWFYYVTGQEVEIRAARRQLRIFAVAVIALAALCMAFYFAHSAPSFWHNQRGFGPFPNRNQTANLFGLTSIVVVACGYDAIRYHRKTWVFWLGGLAIVIAAIVLNFSRAGIAILIIGVATWLAVFIFRSGKQGRIAIGISALLLLLTALLLFGGQTLERFNLRGSGTTIGGDFRWLIYHDTFTLIRATPWPGLGLGNFEDVFAIFRDVSLGQNRALHPESDWLWLCSEVGWPAVALILFGAAVLVRRCFPFVEGTNQWFRLAALIAAFVFAAHSLFDVAGHRVGSAYAGLFLFGLSLRRPFDRVARRWFVGAFRVLGIFLVALGLTWIVTIYRQTPLPGAIGADVQRSLAKRDNVGRLYTQTILDATSGLGWAPLDWQLYFLRALGEIGARRPGDALDDFRRARFLEPNSFEVPYQEGAAWLTREPTLVMTAWREALRRAGAQRSELYGRMLSAAMQSNPKLYQMLEEFGGGQGDLALAYLDRANGENFTTAVNRLLEHDPELATLKPAQKEKLFALWSERGDLARLVALLDKHPDWRPLAWRSEAKFLAERKDFHGAFELVRQFGGSPPLPQPMSTSSIEQLQKDSLGNPANYETGLALYRTQMKENKIDDALVTLRRFTERKDAPEYFHFLEAEAWAAKENWERAWNAWQEFDRSSR